MANPGSQYSISTQEEMEMDYYDYNVINASAAPGSYLGMDPAFLVWIPPIDDRGILSDTESEDANDILPMHSDIDPGSNKESPEDDMPPRVPIKPPRKNLKSPSWDGAKPIASSSLNPKEILSKINFLQKTSHKQSSGSIENLECKSPSYIKPEVKRISVIEKETSVIKSPSDTKISDYYELSNLSDIKFADDDEIDESGDMGASNHYKDTAFQVTN